MEGQREGRRDELNSRETDLENLCRISGGTYGVNKSLGRPRIDWSRVYQSIFMCGLNSYVHQQAHYLKPDAYSDEPLIFNLSM